jgi:hypothetical protein
MLLTIGTPFASGLFTRGRTPEQRPQKIKRQTTERKHSMKKLLTILAVTAALCVSAGSVMAQNNGGGGGGGGRPGRGGGNFDPAQMQQRMLQRMKDQLGFTNDTDWSAVEPLVQKVMDARRETMAAMFGGFRRGGPGGGQGGGNQGPANPERDALQQAIDANAPAAQIKTLLEKYRTAQKAKQAKLEQAQTDLRAVLNQKQEASAVLAGLLN